MSFRQVLETVLDITHRKRMLVSLPWWLASLQAAFLGLLPSPLLTRDQLIQLKSDNVVSTEAEQSGRTFAGLGMQPQSSAAILPSYLWTYRASGQFGRTPA